MSRAMPGIVELLSYKAAFDEATGGASKGRFPGADAATDAMRNMPIIDALPRGFPRAVGVMIFGQIAHKEANKARVNPKIPFLPLRGV